MYVYMVNLYKLSYTRFYSQIRINNKNISYSKYKIYRLKRNVIIAYHSF